MSPWFSWYCYITSLFLTDFRDLYNSVSFHSSYIVVSISSLIYTIISGSISTNCSKDKDASTSSLWTALVNPAFSKTCPTNELEVCAVYPSFLGDTVNTFLLLTLSSAFALTSDNKFSASAILTSASSSFPTTLL